MHVFKKEKKKKGKGKGWGEVQIIFFFGEKRTEKTEKDNVNLLLEWESRCRAGETSGMFVGLVEKYYMVENKHFRSLFYV